ncbi:hypothetical protein ABT154_18465 [Streptomyces sp. NPDC001728]|uniref:hypothetical protein n=1 Tax=Streptomyces sp. NPDC001728 TaxID=3154396 RepID=UPI00331C2E2A
MFTCDHLFRIEWNTTGSWINNQRSDLYADFYDKAKAIRWTSPGGLSYDPQAMALGLVREPLLIRRSGLSPGAAVV